SAAAGAHLCREFLRITCTPRSPLTEKPQKSAVSSNWHAHCYIYRVHLVPRQTKGAALSGSLVPRTAAPFLFSRREKLLELAALEHLHHDVRSADELAADVKLRNGRPVAIFLDALTDLRVLQDVDRLILGPQPVEDCDRAARKAALRKQRRPFHEEHNVVGVDDLGDSGLRVAHWVFS